MSMSVFFVQLKAMLCQTSSNPNDQMPQAIPTFDPTSPDIARNIKKPINDQNIQVFIAGYCCTSIQVPDFCCAVHISHIRFPIAFVNKNSNQRQNHAPRLCELILKDQLRRVPAPDPGKVKLTWYPGAWRSVEKWKEGIPGKDGSSKEGDSLKFDEKTPFWTISSLFLDLSLSVTWYFLVINQNASMNFAPPNSQP